MEGHANSVEDRLIDGLSFKLAPVQVMFRNDEVLHSIQAEATHIQAAELN
jgi:hypothetical protein